VAVTEPAGVLVVCIDDDASVLSGVARVVRRPGLEVRTSHDPDEVLGWVANEIVAVLITDYEMPRMNGVVLATRVRELRPQTVCILLSGVVSSPIVGLEVEIFRFLGKPFDVRELRAAVAAACDHHDDLVLRAATT